VTDNNNDTPSKRPEPSKSEAAPLEAKPEGPKNVVFRTNLEYRTVFLESRKAPKDKDVSTIVVDKGKKKS